MPPPVRTTVPASAGMENPPSQGSYDIDVFARFQLAKQPGPLTDNPIQKWTGYCF